MRLSSLLGGARRDPVSPAPRSFNVDGTVYAVGDIHGEITLLRGLLEEIRADILGTKDQGLKTLVFLGDYVDRGEDSRAVLELLPQIEIPGCEILFIRGNHEQQMFDFADDPIKAHRWMDWGGAETLESFGIEPVFSTASDKELVRVGTAFKDALGDLREFYEENMMYWHQNGNVVLSHGGMHPYAPIEGQTAQAMLWGTQEFMQQGGPPGYWHVHGHVIHNEPGFYGNRIAVDTGAYKTGILTVARITSKGCDFLGHSLNDR